MIQASFSTIDGRHYIDVSALVVIIERVILMGMGKKKEIEDGNMNVRENE